METHHVICSCHSADHDVRFVKDDDDVWVEVQLTKTKGFFGRCIAAICYIFGYRSKFGHWDCTLLSKEEANKLYHFLKRYKNIDA